MSPPARTQVRSIAACLPEQFCATGSGPQPSRIHALRDTASIGISGVFWRSASVRPAPDRIDRTAMRWYGSPRWDAAEIASSRPVTSRPARHIAIAWIGLSEERGYVGIAASPSVQLV